jgi:phage I-like protein
MTRHHNIANQRVAFTAEEETARDAEEKAWTDDAPNRRMAELRSQRDALLAETDYMGNSDVTMSAKWETYRQALRDITSQTPSDDALSNITFPTKPKE